MTGCCDPRGYERVFTSAQAERDAARYRRKGLRWGPARTVEMHRDATLAGRTLLEVGGGIGDLALELLDAGMAQAVSVELSGAYEPTATRLLDERGLTDRSTRIVGDFATVADSIDAADVVVLHSVACCYHDPERLLAPAAARARRYLVISYPRWVWWMRAWAPVQNLYPRVRGSELRFYVHAPATITAPIERAGLRLVHTERDHIDHLDVFAVQPPAPSQGASSTLHGQGQAGTAQGADAAGAPGHPAHAPLGRGPVRT